MYSNSIREYNQKGFWLEIYPVYQAVVFRDPDVLQDFIYNQLIPNLWRINADNDVIENTKNQEVF